MRTAVVLPAPLGPSNAKIVPSATSRSTPSSTACSPNDFRSPVTTIAGCDWLGNTFPPLVRVALAATTSTSMRAGRFSPVSRGFSRGSARLTGGADAETQAADHHVGVPAQGVCEYGVALVLQYALPQVVRLDLRDQDEHLQLAHRLQVLDQRLGEAAALVVQADQG